ncbi:MFSD5, partial [Symbiodinium pilosum]
IYYGGYTGPFVTANIFLVICLVVMTSSWSENYGQTAKEAAMEQNKERGFMGAVNLVLAQPLIFLCGIVCSLFESSMFIFVFNWTPVLMKPGEPDPPFGHIFAGFMIMCMLGSRLFSLAIHYIPNERIGMYTLCLAALCHASILVVNSEAVHLTAFFVFEMCVGLYFPMMGTMKGQIVP